VGFVTCGRFYVWGF